MPFSINEQGHFYSKSVIYTQKFLNKSKIFTFSTLKT